MKILVVGPDAESREAFAKKIKEHFPDAELVVSEDLPVVNSLRSRRRGFFDEVSSIPQKVWKRFKKEKKR